MQSAKLIVRENTRAGGEPGCEKGARVRFSAATTQVILAAATSALAELIKVAAELSGPTRDRLITAAHISQALKENSEFADCFAECGAGSTGFAVMT